MTMESYGELFRPFVDGYGDEINRQFRSEQVGGLLTIISGLRTDIENIGEEIVRILSEPSSIEGHAIIDKLAVKVGSLNEQLAAAIEALSKESSSVTPKLR